MPFLVPVDVANRAFQHLGVPRIASLTDNSTRQGREANFLFDKTRRAELRRAVWTFSTRRAVLRAKLATTVTVTFATYSLATAYAAGDIVVDSSGYLWLAVAASTGVIPGSENYNPKWVTYFGSLTAQAHDVTALYIPGDLIIASSVIYICIAPSFNHAPPNATYWHVVQGATGAVPAVMFPQGYDQDGTLKRNIYRLPANYIRMAPQDAKTAGANRLMTSAGQQWNDWELEAGFLYTVTNSDPLLFRFVADQADVTIMDDLFCEVWAARMAVELAEVLRQNSEKKQECLEAYIGFVNTAKAVNAIEGGSTEGETPEPGPPARQAAR